MVMQILGNVGLFLVHIIENLHYATLEQTLPLFTDMQNYDRFGEYNSTFILAANFFL